MHPGVLRGELAVEGPPVAAVDPDLVLLQSAAAGDREAFDCLVERHWCKLVSVAGRFLDDPNEVEDAAQEALVRAFASLAGFRQEASVRTWLIRITVNVCRNRRRSYWFRKVTRCERPWEPPSVAVDPVALAELGFEAVELQRAVSRLPEKLRLPVVLHFYEGLSGPEVAAVLGWNTSTVWTRIYAACRALRKDLGSSEP